MTKLIKKLSIILIILTLFIIGLSKESFANQKSILKESIEEFKKELIKNEEIIEELEDEIEFQTSELEALEIFIKKSKKEIEDLEKDQGKSQESFNKRLRVMYKNRNESKVLTFIQLIMNADNIADAYKRAETYKKILAYDKELLETRQLNNNMLVSKKSVLESAEEEANKKIKVLSEDLKELDSKRDKINQDIKANEVKLSKIIKEEEAELLKKQREAALAQKQLAYKFEPEVINTLEQSNGYVWPLPSSKRVTSKFGYRIHPILKTKKLHTGVDVGAPTGSPVFAAVDGIITVSDWMGGYGKTVMITSDNMTTLYAHNSELVAEEGTYVKAGDLIAYVGTTGRSTGPHMHFEVKINGKLIDPLSLYDF